MTEDEVRQMVKKCGWSYLRRLRRGRNWYAYAAKHVKGKRYERYLGPVTGLPRLTDEELKRILTS